MKQDEIICTSFMGCSCICLVAALALCLTAFGLCMLALVVT
jgi:hypothetical protein